MFNQGSDMFSWIPNAHIKFPTTSEGLKAASNAVSQGMRVNMTLVFTQEQAAAVYGATQGAKKGGVSGPGILPVTVRCVYEIYEAVKIPIIGMGGITKWQDVVEAMMAGATLVGVGTASYSKGMKVYEDLKLGLQAYMGKEGIKNLKELVGAGHKN